MTKVASKKPWVMTPARARNLERATARKQEKARARLLAAQGEAAQCKVLLAGIDTLYLSTRAELRPDVVAELRELRQRAADAKGTRRKEYRELKGQGRAQEALELKKRSLDLPRWRPADFAVDFEVQPFGVRKGLVLLVSDGLVLVLNPDGPRNLPRAYVECRSAFLWSGWDAAADSASALLATVTAGNPDVQVSRLDLACDFAGWLPTPELLESIVGRVIRRDPIYEHHTELGEEAPRRKPFAKLHNTGRTFTGFTFGGGPLLCRLYDKTVELRRSGKKWFEPKWAAAGWRGVEEDGHVWRLEFQVRRDSLRHAELSFADDALEMRSWADVKRGLDGLWQYLTQKWLSYRLPRTKERRVIYHPRWEVLQGASFNSSKDGELHRHQKLFTLERNTGALAGYFKRELSLLWYIRGREPDRSRYEEDLRDLLDTAKKHYETRHDDDLYAAASADFERQLKWRNLFGRPEAGKA